MSIDNPFQPLFETLGRLPAAHAESVNRQAYDTLHDLLSVPVEKVGRIIQLRAPRAGYGKTHLLSRLELRMGTSHEFIPLRAALGYRIDAVTTMDDAVHGLLRPVPSSGGLRAMDLVARRMFAKALEPLVISGEVPCQDRDAALTALRARPIETFDFHQPDAITARWARDHFDVLGPRLSTEIALRCKQPHRKVAFWVDIWFRFATTPLNNPARMRILTDAVRNGNPSESGQMDRLRALLSMLALLRRVVLVADDLEGITADEKAALKLAAFLTSMRQSAERVDVILSLNLDVWERSFISCLSGGMVDRLSEVVIQLHPLTEEEMLALLESHVPGLGNQLFERLDRTEESSYARGLIRAAGAAWLRASAMDSHISAPMTPPPVPLIESASKKTTPVSVPAAPSVMTPVSPVSAPFTVTKVDLTENERPPVPDSAASQKEDEVRPPATSHTPVFPVSAPSTVTNVDLIEKLPTPDSAASQIEEEVRPPTAPRTPVSLSPPASAAAFIAPPTSPFAPAQIVARENPTEDEISLAPLSVVYRKPTEWRPVLQSAPAPLSEATPAAPVVGGLEIAEPPEVLEGFDAPASRSISEKPSALDSPESRAFASVASSEKIGAPDPDRVDKLLQQFRERYGRASL